MTWSEVQIALTGFGLQVSGKWRKDAHQAFLAPILASSTDEQLIGLAEHIGVPLRAEVSTPATSPFREHGLDTFVPLGILREAMKAVPAVRYALGVAGIISVLAIIRAFGLDFRLAFFGSLLVLAMMISLVIFAQVSKFGPTYLRLPALILVWSFLPLMITATFLLFTSVFFSWPLEWATFVRSPNPSISDVDPGDESLDSFPPPLPPENFPDPPEEAKTFPDDVARASPEYARSLCYIRNETDEPIFVAFSFLPHDRTISDSSRFRAWLSTRLLPGERKEYEWKEAGGYYHISVFARKKWYSTNEWINLGVTPTRWLTVLKTDKQFGCMLSFEETQP